MKSLLSITMMFLLMFSAAYAADEIQSDMKADKMEKYTKRNADNPEIAIANW